MAFIPILTLIYWKFIRVLGSEGFWGCISSVRSTGVDICIVCLFWAGEERVAVFLWCVHHQHLSQSSSLHLRGLYNCCSLYLERSSSRYDSRSLPYVLENSGYISICQRGRPHHSFKITHFPPHHSLYLFSTLLLFLALMGILHYMCFFVHLLFVSSMWALCGQRLCSAHPGTPRVPSTWSMLSQ